MKSQNIDLRSLTKRAKEVLPQLRRYSLVAFIVFIVALYGFVLLRINSSRSIEPSETDVSGQVEAARVPHIDESVVKQLESLQDNSVSVQTLFDQARSNPFQ